MDQVFLLIIWIFFYIMVSSLTAEVHLPNITVSTHWAELKKKNYILVPSMVKDFSVIHTAKLAMRTTNPPVQSVVVAP
jgi:hypothetical protein